MSGICKCLSDWSSCMSFFADDLNSSHVCDKNCWLFSTSLTRSSKVTRSRFIQYFRQKWMNFCVISGCRRHTLSEMDQLFKISGSTTYTLWLFSDVILGCFVSFRFALFRFVPKGSVSFGLGPFRSFCFSFHFIGTQLSLSGPRSSCRIVVSEFNWMHWGYFYFRMRGCSRASNIFDGPTSKYSTINISCRIAHSVEQKTDRREAPGSIARDITFFFFLDFYSFSASEAPTGNAANVNMLDLSVAHDVQFIQYEQ
jgi:hypothetical protein